ncbi:hypothetical protein STEG23_023567, partial [Scotinomys teguina]
MRVVNRKIWNTRLHHSWPSCLYAREFSFDPVFLPFLDKGHGTMYSLLELLQSGIGMLISGAPRLKLVKRNGVFVRSRLLGGMEENHPMIKCKMPKIEPIWTTPRVGGIRYDFKSKYLDKTQISTSNESPVVTITIGKNYINNVYPFAFDKVRENDPIFILP